MPPRLFPFPFRVGNDICNIGRIYDIIAKDPKVPTSKGSPLNRFLPKLLTWPEQQYFYHRFQEKPDWSGHKANESLKKVAQFLAGRWAAKEAIRKACEHLGSSNGFHHIIILPVIPPKSSPGATSRPQALILRDRLSEPPRNPLKEANAYTMDFDLASMDGQLCEVSISHDTKYATAVALVPVVEEWQSQAVPSKSEDHQG